MCVALELGSWILKFAFGFDALVSTGFGLYSWADPLATFGTIVDIAGAGTGRALVLSALRSLAVYYVVIGLIALTAIWLSTRARIAIAAVFLLRHVWTLMHGLLDIGSPWLVGNPWPDVVIHTAFVLFYLVGALISWRALTAAPRRAQMTDEATN